MFQENETFKIRGLSILPNQLLVKIEILDETERSTRFEEVPLPVSEDENQALDLLVAGVLRLMGETIERLPENGTS